jgi:ceramide glucosyltransferase
MPSAAVTLLHLICAGTGALLLVAACGYALMTFCAVLVWNLRAAHRPTGGPQPPVTLLKPLCGTEPELYLNLRSFCLQKYPTYQLVFGVRDASDPAVSAVQRLMREFPRRPIDLVIDETLHGGNRKVSNLLNMLPRARHELLIIADSDTRVGPDYLEAVTRPLLDARTGMVTCIYRSVPAGGLWSRLGSMYINDWYMPSVLLAWLFGHRCYASGQTMGVRRDTLAAVGGLESVVNHLADDYRLAEGVRRAGLQVVMSRYTLETVESEPTANDLMRHELRWMRTIRALAPGGFRFLFVSFTLPLLALGWLLAGAQPGIASRAAALVAIGLTARLGVALLPRLAQRRIPLSDLLLLPVRDVLLCWTWLRAMSVSQVRWRGSDYQIDQQGILRSGCSPVTD